jgi:hypothetical protein
MSSEFTDFLPAKFSVHRTNKQKLQTETENIISVITYMGIYINLGPTHL